MTSNTVTTTLSNRFVQLCDRFLHPSWRDDPDRLFRARTLIGILLFLQISAITTFVYGVFFSPLPPFGIVIVIVLMSSAFAVFVGLPFYLRRTGQLLRGAQIVTATTFVITEFGILISGGPPLSPTLSVAVVIPVLAFCLGGRKMGLWWTYFCLFTQIALMIGGRFGIEYINTTLPQQAGLIKILVWGLSFFDIVGIVLVYETINLRLRDERDLQHEQYQHLATHDALTGVANRSKFLDRLQFALDRRKRNNTLVALIYLDLNGFKQVNDELGHEAGDQVLRIVSQRLQNILRKTDTIARLGGDEFAVILEDIDTPAQAQAVTLRLLTALSQPIEEFPNFPISGSFGIALAPLHASDGATLTQLADRAMYRAKKEKSAIAIFDPQFLQAENSAGAI